MGTVCTVIVAAVISVSVFFAVRSIIRSISAGKCFGCSGECENCNKK